MFYCEPCAQLNDWPTYVGPPISYGLCEVCRYVRTCYDVPSRFLTPARETNPDK